MRIVDHERLKHDFLHVRSGLLDQFKVTHDECRAPKAQSDGNIMIAAFGFSGNECLRRE